MCPTGVMKPKPRVGSRGRAEVWITITFVASRFESRILLPSDSKYGCAGSRAVIEPT